MLNRLLIASVVMIASVTAISAQGWKKIGSKTIDFKNVNEAIVVENTNRTYSKFKLSVAGASVRILRLFITFKNGEQRRFDNGFTIENGETTNEVDIGATKTGIGRIDFWYESRSLNAKKAKIILYALPVK